MARSLALAPLLLLLGCPAPEPSPPPPPPVVLRDWTGEVQGLLDADRVDVAARAGGVVTSIALLGERVDLGAPVAEVQPDEGPIVVARAPVPGVVMETRLRIGERVIAGAPLLTILRRPPILLRFAVPSDAAIGPGMVVGFRTQLEDASREARLTRVSEGEAVGEVVGPLDDLRPGMLATIVSITRAR